MATTSSNSVSLGYGNWLLKVAGTNSLGWVAGALLLGGFAYAVFSGYITLREDTRTIVDELRVITYIISQPQDERPELAIPKALRGRLRDGR